MEKLKCSFPTSCKQCYPQRKSASQLYTVPQRRLRRRKAHPSFIHKGKKEVIIIKTVNTGYMVRAPTGGRTTPLQLNTATPQHLRSVGTAASTGRLFSYPKTKKINFPSRRKRQKVRTIWHFLIPQSQYYRHLLSHWAQDWAYGA